LKTQNENFATAIGALAAISTFGEIAATPKPGLVDSLGAGAHSDMDWALFMRSAGALAPFWAGQALDGMTCGESGPYPGLFHKLRSRGIEMERAMLDATGGVNTHKGLIFALSLLAGSAGVCLSEGGCQPDAIRKKSSEIAAPFMEEEFQRIKTRVGGMSHGEKIYLLHGIGGIRSEAMNAFPSLGASLDVYESASRRGAAANDAALCALLTLMTVCEDTNVIHRAGIAFWRGEYLERTREALETFNPLEPDYGPLFTLDGFLIGRGVSPGGAADLLACTLFLHRSKIFDDYL
jgi:triphosphoribosyl-dephospho-CoA synthetase